MICRLKVMLVCFQCLRTAPGHVTHESFFSSLNLSRCLRFLTNEPHLLGYKPVSESMDVQVNPYNITKLIPMFLETIVVIGISSTRQQEGIGIIKGAHPTMTLVTRHAFCVHIT